MTVPPDLPAGAVLLCDIVERDRANPKRAAAMERARKRVDDALKSTVAPDTGAAASGVMGPVVTPEAQKAYSALVKIAADLARGAFLPTFEEGRRAGPRQIDRTVDRAHEQHKIAALDIRDAADALRRAARSAPAVPTGVATTPQGETCAVCGGAGRYIDPKSCLTIVCTSCGGRSTTRDRE